MIKTQCGENKPVEHWTSAACDLALSAGVIFVAQHYEGLAYSLI
jgi:hypothetical protein